MFGSIPKYVELDWFDKIDFGNACHEAELSIFFDSVLPPYDSQWARNLLSWGSDDGNRIEITVIENTIKDIQIRVDLRCLDPTFLRLLVGYAERNDLLFFSIESQRFIEPHLPELMKEIENSRKAVFVRDSERFFKDRRYLDAINSENLKRIIKNK